MTGIPNRHDSATTSSLNEIDRSVGNLNPRQGSSSTSTFPRQIHHAWTSYESFFSACKRQQDLIVCVFNCVLLLTFLASGHLPSSQFYLNGASSVTPGPYSSSLLDSETTPKHVCQPDACLCPLPRGMELYGAVRCAIFILLNASAFVAAVLKLPWYLEGGRTILMVLIRVAHKLFLLVDVLTWATKRHALQECLQIVVRGDKGVMLILGNSVLTQVPLKHHIVVAVLDRLLVVSAHLLLEPNAASSLTMVALQHFMVGLAVPTAILLVLEQGIYRCYCKLHSGVAQRGFPRLAKARSNTAPNSSSAAHTSAYGQVLATRELWHATQKPRRMLPPLDMSVSKGPPDMGVTIERDEPPLKAQEYQGPQYSRHSHHHMAFGSILEGLSRGFLLCCEQVAAWLGCRAEWATSTVAYLGVGHGWESGTHMGDLGMRRGRESGNGLLAQLVMEVEADLCRKQMRSSGSGEERDSSYCSPVTMRTVSVKIHHPCAYQQRWTIIPAIEHNIREVYRTHSATTHCDPLISTTAVEGCLQLLIHITEPLLSPHSPHSPHSPPGWSLSGGQPPPQGPHRPQLQSTRVPAQHQHANSAGVQPLHRGPQSTGVPAEYQHASSAPPEPVYTSSGSSTPRHEHRPHGSSSVEAGGSGPCARTLVSSIHAALPPGCSNYAILIQVDRMLTTFPGLSNDIGCQ